ncbi:hypothetical protein IJT17_06205 [bacterium]|nr:hypothetical protein [bacterium]
MPWKWLIVIAIAALAIRLTAAYIQPPFIDEGHVYYVTKAGWHQLITELKIDVHPPTYNALIYPLVQATSSIFCLRLPSVLLSLPALLLVYLIAIRFANEPLALGITAVYALNRAIWITDAQLRSYGALGLAILTVWLGMLDMHAGRHPLASVLPRSSRWGWSLFALASVLAASFHVLGSVAICTAALFSFCFIGRKRLIALLTATVSLIPIASWFAWSRETAQFQGKNVVYHASWDSYYSMPLSILGCWDATSFNDIAQGTAWQTLCADYLPIFYTLANVTLCALFLLGWYLMARERSWEGHFLGLSAVLPWLALGFADRMGWLTFQARYLVPFCLPFLLLVFRSLQPWGRRLLLGLILTIGTANCLLFPFFPPMWNQSWQESLDFIKSAQREGDTIAITIPSNVYGLAMAYNPEHIRFIFQDNAISNVMIDQDSVPGKLRVMPIDYPMASPQLLDYLGSGRLFLIICQPRESTSALLGWLDQYYTVIGTQKTCSMTNWGSMLVLQLERKQP